jgi:long-chain acyl-CoA synthetase
MTNLVSQLREVVRDHPEETALSVAGNETTYTKLWAMTGRFAAGLVERGVEPGDPVALYLPNLPQFVVGFHGILRAGGVVVPMNPQYTSREIRHLLKDSGATAVLTTTDRVPEIAAVHDETDVRFIVTADGEGDFSTGFADFLGTDADFDFWELAGRDDDDLAALPYTSGTTGDPKGVELTHGNLTSNTAAAADLVPDGVGPDDAALGALPLFHIYGMTVVMNATLLNGGTFLPMAEWDAGRAFELVEEMDVSILHGVPAMYHDMLHHPDAGDHDLSGVRLAGVGGSGIPVEVLREFEERFDVTIYEGYGLTETSPVTHFNAPGWGRRVGSVGKALPDVDARVVDDDFDPVAPVEAGPVEESEADLTEFTGELVVSGPNVMAGYRGLPEANEAAFTEADGRRWFHTGDVAYHDEDGYVYVVDRKTDVVVTGGYNVYPREVEELLFEHDAVADVAVVGVPDERRGETVKAFVVGAPDAEVTADDVRQFCLDNLAEYKHPREVEFVDELPRTSTGKVQKHRLRERSAPVEAGEGEASSPDAGDAEDDGTPLTAEDLLDGADSVLEEVETEVASDDPAAPDADGEEPTELEEISGVGPTKGETLREAGFDSVADVRAASHDALAEVEGIGEALAEQIKTDVEDD